jgi:hypothetical protein
MDGDIGTTIKHRSLDLLDEDALATHFPDRDVEARIGHRLNNNTFERERDARRRRCSRQQFGDMIGLPQGEGTSAGGGPDVN